MHARELTRQHTPTVTPGHWLLAANHEPDDYNINHFELGVDLFHRHISPGWGANHPESDGRWRGEIFDS